VAGLFDHPYAGLVVGIALPAMLVLGLLLISTGLWLERRARARHPDAPGDWPVLDFRQTRVRRTALMVGALTAVNIVIVLLGSHSSLRLDGIARLLRPGVPHPDAAAVCGMAELGACRHHLRAVSHRANSETTTTLRLRIEAIHRHADPATRIEFVATGAAAETIPYVKVTRPDGLVREYVTADATDQVIRDGPRRTMDCIDCHNTVGHPIAPTAERAVDAAMAAGLVSRQLPHARREAVRLMKASYAGEAEAVDTIEREFRGFFRSRGEMLDEHAIVRTVAALQAMYRRNVFPDMKVTLGSYPDNRGHLTVAGCFRCHDDSHTDTTGAVISADCESCHSQVVAQQ
jgi:hypothetical protein